MHREGLLLLLLLLAVPMRANSELTDITVGIGAGDVFERDQRRRGRDAALAGDFGVDVDRCGFSSRCSAGSRGERNGRAGGENDTLHNIQLLLS